MGSKDPRLNEASHRGLVSEDDREASLRDLATEKMAHRKIFYFPTRKFKAARLMSQRKSEEWCKELRGLSQVCMTLSMSWELFALAQRGGEVKNKVYKKWLDPEAEVRFVPPH